MKNRAILAKILPLISGLVTVVLVTFFIMAAWVWAASSWQGPNNPPPEGNPSGFIQASPPSAQEARININGDAEVGNLIIKPTGSFIFGLEDPISSWPDLCAEISPSVCTGWFDGGGFEGLWKKSGETGPDIYYNAGDIGMGTENPGDDGQGRKNVHIYSNNGSRLIIDGAGNNPLSAAFLDFVTLGDGKKTVNNTATKGWNFMAYGNGYTAPLQNDLRIRYYNGTVPTDVIHLTDNGNVGIGTVSPGAKLEVIGNANFLAGAGGSPFVIDASGLPTTNNYSGITLKASSNSGSGTFDTHIMNWGGIFKWTRGSASGDVELMRIDASSGNVGIGTATLGNDKLTVYQNSTAGSVTGLFVNAAGANTSGSSYGIYVSKTAGAGGTGVAGYFNATGGTNNYGLIVANGNVGIGTTAPTAKLQINSADPDMAKFVGTTAANQRVQISNTAATMNLGVGTGTTPYPYIWSNNGSFFIGNDGNPTLFVNGMVGNTTGRVGIGKIASANYKLDVEGRDTWLPTYGKTQNYEATIHAAAGPYANADRTAGFFENPGFPGYAGSWVKLAYTHTFGNVNTEAYGVIAEGNPVGVKGTGLGYSSTGIGVIGEGNDIGVKGTTLSDRGENYGTGIGVSGSANSHLFTGNEAMGEPNGWYTGTGVSGTGLGYDSVGVSGFAGKYCLEYDITNNDCIRYDDYTVPGTGVYGLGGDGATGVKGTSDTGWAGYFKVADYVPGPGYKGVYIDKLCLGSETNCRTDWSGGGGSSLWTDAGTYIYNPGNTVRVYDNGGLGRNDGAMSLYLWGSKITDGQGLGYANLEIRPGGSPGTFDLQNGAGTSMIYSSGTNIGIGTRAPAQKLEVAGNIKASGYYSSDGSAGLTKVINVRNAAGTGSCTITVKNGLITATTCP